MLLYPFYYFNAKMLGRNRYRTCSLKHDQVGLNPQPSPLHPKP